MSLEILRAECEALVAQGAYDDAADVIDGMLALDEVEGLRAAVGLERAEHGEGSALLAGTLSNLGAALAEAGNRAAAAEAYLECARIYASLGSAHACRFFVTAGFCYERAADNARAEASFLSALEHEPSEEEAYPGHRFARFGLSCCASHGGRPEQSLAIALEGLREPWSPGEDTASAQAELWGQVGTLAHHAGQDPLARYAFRAALVLSAGVDQQHAYAEDLAELDRLRPDGASVEPSKQCFHVVHLDASPQAEPIACVAHPLEGVFYVPAGSLRPGQTVRLSARGEGWIATPARG